MTGIPSPGEARFWDLAEPLLARPDVQRSTRMGLPCLRVDGAFFASFDRRSGSLLVKVVASRVHELIAAGSALPFAPAGRRFREWVAVPEDAHESWSALLEEALRTRASPTPPRSGDDDE